MIRFAHHNLVLTSDGRWIALYRLPTVSYPYLPARTKHALYAQLAAFATQVGADFSLHRVSRTTIEDGVSEQTPEVYVAVNAHTPARGLLERLLTAAQRPLPGAAVRAVTHTSLTRAQLREQEIGQLAATHLAARRATTSELRWLYARAPLRGTEPATDPNWRGDALVIEQGDDTCYQAVGAPLDSLIDCRITEEATHLAIDSCAGRSYQATLVAGALPTGRTFPGAELLFAPLDTPGAIVDATVTVEWIPNARALRFARRQLLDADNAQADHDTVRRHTDARIDEQHETAAAFKTYLETDTSPPILKATITFGIAAQTLTSLDHTARELTSRTAPVALARPAYVQRALWDRQLPGAPIAPVLGAQLLTVEQFAALMPIASERSGTASGPVIGMLPSSGRRVRLDLAAASRESRPPSVLLVGSQGSGKTMTAQLLALHTAEAGGLVIDVDPKPDHHLDSLPQLDGQVTIIDLSSGSHHGGLLDPMRCADPDLREELTTGFLTQLLGVNDPETSTQIRTAIRSLPSEATSRDVIAHLSTIKTRRARQLAGQLATWADTPLASLAFASPDTQTATDTTLVTTIRCRGLVLPSPTLARSERSDSERISVALIGLIAAFAMRLATSDTSRRKLVLIDEAWLLLQSSEGRALIDRLNRTGRAVNASLVLATQHLHDAAELTDLIGTYLVFGQETPTQCEHVLALLGLDQSDDLIDQLTRFRRGACLMRDIDGQLAHVQITPPPDLLRLLDTTPPTKAAPTTKGAA